MDLEIKFSYHFPDGIILTEDGILTKGNEQSLYCLNLLAMLYQKI